MPISELEIAAGLAIIGAIPLSFWLLRMTFRILNEWPALGFMASLFLMGWAYQNPTAVPALVDRASPDFMEQIEAQALAQAEPTVLDDSELTDENLVDQYHQKNIRYAHQIERAPQDAARRLQR